MKIDTVVIGAGVSGLTASILLAQNGRKVTLLEKSHVIAPTIRGFVRNNVYFDTGFHYAGMLGDNQPLAKLCRRLGILSRIKIRKEENSTGERFYCTNPEFKLDFKSRLDIFVEQLCDTFPEDKQAITQFFRSIKQFLNNINDDLFGVVLNPASVFEDTQISLAQYLQKNFKSAILQTILSSHALLYGSLPQETSLFYHSIVAGGYYDQNQQVVDGGKAIAKAFESELQRYNIEAHTNCAVNKIYINDSNKVEAVELENGEKIECENCVFTSHLRLLNDMLPEGSFRPVYRKRIENLEDTSSAIVIYCVSDKINDADVPSNIIIAHQPFPEMFNLEGGFCNYPMFISTSLSEDYIGGVSIICPCKYEAVEKWGDSRIGNRSSEYYEWKKETAEAIVDSVKCHCHDVMGDLEIIDTASPLTFRDYMNAPYGCLYGAKHKIDDMPFLPRTKIEGLYLSGQAIVTAGLMGAMLSGFFTAAAITGEDYRKTI